MKICKELVAFKIKHPLLALGLLIVYAPYQLINHVDSFFFSLVEMLTLFGLTICIS